ncbi:MAG: hypothetical protein Q9166_003874 [cf. Caloplaca sp. 2 TL-2023]
MLFISVSETLKGKPSLSFLHDRKYAIQDCGTFTDRIEVALDLGKEPLAAAINAAKQGIKNPNGFLAWFKDDAAVPRVTEILENIHSMKPLRRLWPYPNPFVAQPPVFVCVKEDTIKRYRRLGKDPHKYCQDSGAFGLYLNGMKYIWLCEKFFKLRITPLGPPTKNCPRVIDNQFVKKEVPLLSDYQVYLLIHEMVHFYLGWDSLGWNTTPKEIYPSNYCVNFDMKNSLRNPMNYQYFVASKSSWSLN